MFATIENALRYLQLHRLLSFWFINWTICKLYRIYPSINNWKVDEFRPFGLLSQLYCWQWSLSYLVVAVFLVLLLPFALSCCWYLFCLIITIYAAARFDPSKTYYQLFLSVFHGLSYINKKVDRLRHLNWLHYNFFARFFYIFYICVTPLSSP